MASSVWQKEALRDVNPDEIFSEFEKAHINQASLGSTAFRYSYYPTKLAVKFPPIGDRDLVKEWVAAADKYGIKLGLYTRCMVNFADHPEWGEVSAAGAVNLHFICVNSPYRESFIAQLKELITKYKIYGLWIDSVHWGNIMHFCPTDPNQFYCFCEFCKENSIRQFIPDLIEIGVDALNPVQVSAANMDTKSLKEEFGDKITFWGGGCDTQRVLPFGTPSEVKEEVKRRISDLAPGGGFVFSQVHNIQPDVPPQNMVAMYEAARKYGKY